jgi:hypothetical protein
VPQKIEEKFGLAATGAEMHVGNPDRAVTAHAQGPAHAARPRSNARAAIATARRQPPGLAAAIRKGFCRQSAKKTLASVATLSSGMV